MIGKGDILNEAVSKYYKQRLITKKLEICLTIFLAKQTNSL